MIILFDYCTYVTDCIFSIKNKKIYNIFCLLFRETIIELYNIIDNFYSRMIGIPSNIDICVSFLTHSVRQICSSIDSCIGLPKKN